MSDQFKGFDEAVTLYAKHLPLILEMEKMFDENMLCLIKALRLAIEKHVPRRLLKFNRGKKPKDDPRPSRARHICLADDDKGAWNHAFLSLNMRDVAPAASRQLNLVADAPHADEQQLRRLWEIPDQQQLSAFCKLRGRVKRQFFDVTVDLSDDDTLDSAGERIAAVLKALYKAESGRVAR